MGSRALLVIDGAPPQVMSAGQSQDGVTLVSADGEIAVIEVQGQRQTLRVGQSPVRLAAPAGATQERRIVLHAGSGGHFTGVAQFNGAALPFVVDTGASNVVIGASQADQIGLKYRNGTREVVVTANGTAKAYRLQLDSVRVGGVTVYNVEATVVPAGMPFVLLGNSLLGRFQMQQENDQLVLEKRY